jgi:kinesin family protein 4/21/27
VRELVLTCFEGYNAAVLAYGQTGSGKTYTMGTGLPRGQEEQEEGIIPKVIKEIFGQVEERREVSKFIIRVSFI